MKQSPVLANAQEGVFVCELASARVIDDVFDVNIIAILLEGPLVDDLARLYVSVEEL